MRMHWLIRRVPSVQNLPSVELTECRICRVSRVPNFCRVPSFLSAEFAECRVCLSAEFAEFVNNSFPSLEHLPKKFLFLIRRPNLVWGCALFCYTRGTTWHAVKPEALNSRQICARPGRVTLAIDNGLGREISCHGGQATRRWPTSWTWATCDMDVIILNLHVAHMHFILRRMIDELRL